MEKYYVVIPAAGQGKRMGAGMNKQFLQLKNEPLIVHTLRFFESDEACVEVVLVANEADCQAMEGLVNQYGLLKVNAVVQGGVERQHSVYNGLDYLNGHVDDQIVIIHDGARPFLTKKMVTDLVLKAREYGASTTAVRVKDTIKRVNSGKVVDTLKRDELWSIQTPQAFRFPLLKLAHQKAEEANLIGTDDASLVEWLGHDVHITEGDYHNIKLTTPEDLLFAEAIMSERKREQS